MEGEADLLCPAGNDVSCCMTASYLPSALPMLLFYPSVVGLLLSGLAHSSGVIAELGVCVQEALGRAVPPGAVFSCLKYSKVKNWMSWIQDENELGSLSSLKLGPSWFACPVNGKKTELLCLTL